MFRCAGCSGTGRPAAVNAPAVTRAGCRRPGACQGTNIARRSTAGTTYSPGWASRHLEPGLFVTAFTYLLDRLQDTGRVDLRTFTPSPPRPTAGRQHRCSPTPAGARPHPSAYEPAAVPAAPSPKP